MRLFALPLALLLVATAVPAGSSSINFVVIVHKSNQLSSLTPSKLEIIFLRKISRWPWGAEIVPVDLPEQSAARKEFSRSILNSTPEQMGVYWIDQKVTRNQDGPLQAANPVAAKAIVSSKPGAIAYVPISIVDDSVKVVEVH